MSSGNVVPEPAAADETAYSCGATDAAAQNWLLSHNATFGINTTAPDCGVTGLGVTTTGANTVAHGSAGGWTATTPSGLQIVGVVVPSGSLYTAGVVGTGYVADFLWQGGSGCVGDVTPPAGRFAQGGFASSYLGFGIRCAPSQGGSCRADSDMQVMDIALQVHETQGPWLEATGGLWTAPGWVRGDWPLGFQGDSPSGLCTLSATLNGIAIPGTASSVRTATVWHQCSSPAYSEIVHTGEYGEGTVLLGISATDAAGMTTPASIYRRSISIDNSTPTLQLSGPVDQPVTAGTQYVTASAAGGPSGLEGIYCSVDAGGRQRYAGASAEIAVSGVGEHTVRCQADGNAVDSAGNHAWSTPQSWSLKIGLPTVSGIAFSRVADAPKCATVRRRVRLPNRVVIIRRHGQVTREVVSD
jgi:hypothetical protein